MSIYARLLQKADKGKRFKIDLKNKNLWLGTRQVISEGEVLIDEDELICEHDLANVPDLCFDLKEDPWKVVSKMYEVFKHSVPNKNWKDNGYFRALDADALTVGELAYNLDRKFTQAALEGYILLATLKGWLVWEDDNHWFWQDLNNPECVVLREWVK